MGNFKVYITKKVGSNCSLCDFVDAVLSTLTKQTILPIIQKVMRIILTFSTKMWFLLFSNYSGNNLPRPNWSFRVSYGEGGGGTLGFPMPVNKCNFWLNIINFWFSACTQPHSSPDWYRIIDSNSLRHPKTSTASIPQAGSWHCPALTEDLIQLTPQIMKGAVHIYSNHPMKINNDDTH